VLRRVESDEPRQPSILDLLGLRQSQPVVPRIAEAEMETALLPHDHPQWMKDALSVSNRARELISQLKPIVIRVLSFWDHRIRSAIVGGSHVTIDPSGSYRAE
jgi:hypothetical protein